MNNNKIYLGLINGIWDLRHEKPKSAIFNVSIFLESLNKIFYNLISRWTISK